MAYYQILLSDMLKELGEDQTKAILSSFSCGRNKDVQDFIRQKAITYCKQGISATHLVFADYKEHRVFAGYYTISMSKQVRVKCSILNRRTRDRLKKFGEYDDISRCYIVPMPLIGQLSKNDPYCNAMTGDELLGMALKTVSRIQLLGGGRFVYLECEDKERLLEFYRRNGFMDFDKRELERDEEIPGHYLVQMLRYISQSTPSE